MAEIDVINRALRILGETPITSTTAPETNAGKHLVAIYDQCRREVLEAHPWNFAERWESVDLTNAPAFGYDDAYVLPSDFIALLMVGDIREDERDYRLLYQGNPDYQRVIALDNNGEDTLQIAYTADVTLLNLWSPLAVKVLALWIAADSVNGVTGQETKYQYVNDLLEKAFKDATGVDGNQQSVRVHLQSGVQQARNEAQYGDGLPFTQVNYS